MRVVVQRVLESSVEIDGKIYGSINKGFCLLVGITHDDTIEIVEKMARKVGGMRVFDDDAGKMNLSLKDVSGNILSISQFTLYADCKKGNRPSFNEAAKPETAIELYEAFNKELSSYCNKVETGIFGADMKVSILNDGPVTIILDSETL